jgi:hypothetical protein
MKTKSSTKIIGVKKLTFKEILNFALHDLPFFNHNSV